MFYAVYLLDFHDYIVIPRTWLRDEIKTMESYIGGSGINVSQTHLCYYSVRDGATISIDGKKIPNEEFVPNFRAPISDIFPLNDSIDEGTFYCRVVAFKGQYEFSKSN